MTHEWTNENKDWAVNLCLKLYKQGTRSFSTEILPKNIPGTRGTGCKVPDRYQLINIALASIIDNTPGLWSYQTGGFCKSISKIHLISAHSPNGFFDSNLLCSPVLFELPSLIVFEKYHQDNAPTVQKHRDIRREIANLFCIKQFNGTIEKKDLCMDWDKDFTQFIFIEASILIAIYRVAKIWWCLTDLKFRQVYGNYNYLFLDIIDNRWLRYLSADLQVPNTSDATTYNRWKLISNFNFLGNNDYSPIGQSGGNQLTKEKAKKAIDAELKRMLYLCPSAKNAGELHLFSALEGICDHALAEAIADWTNAADLLIEHSIKSLNRNRQKRTTTTSH
jgi:hypothetical protein